jgi:hypothetical protein
MIDVVSPRDFITCHEMFTDPGYVLQPNVSLYCLTKDYAYFVETPASVDVFNSDTSSFLYIGQFTNALKVIKFPLASFCKLADRLGNPKVKVCFMPNTGRCGSTLLANALGKVPGTLLYAEPDCLTNIGHLWKQKHVTQSEYERMVVATMRILCKPRQETDTICIKTRSCASCHLNTIKKFFPEFTIIFGYRNSLKTVSSFLGLMLSETAQSLAMYLIDSDTFSKYIPWFRRRFFYYFCFMLEENFFTEIADNMNTVELFTYAWANCIKVMQEFLRQGGVLTPILYEDMDADKVATLENVFKELDIDKKHVAVALKAFTEDSQAGSPLSRENISNLKRRKISRENIVKANVILAKFDLPNLGEEFRLTK